MQRMQQSADATSLDELRAFVAVAERGSFTQAARQIGRDATILSRRIRALEQRLGTRLLERTTRRVTTTEAGLVFLARARTILAALDDAEQEAAAHATGAPHGTLRLALPASFGRMWISPALPSFLQRYPELRIEAELSNRYVDLVAEGFDAAVRLGALADSGLVVRKLAEPRRLLCASPSYLARRGVPRHPDQLADHACLGFVGLATYPLWRLTSTTGERATVRIAGPLVTDDAEALLHAAVAGLGVMMVADWLVAREIADGRLVPVLPRWTMLDRVGLYTVVPTSRLVPAKTRAFVDWIAAQFSPVPWRTTASRKRR